MEKAGGVPAIRPAACQGSGRFLCHLAQHVLKQFQWPQLPPPVCRAGAALLWRPSALPFKSDWPQPPAPLLALSVSPENFPRNPTAQMQVGG